MQYLGKWAILPGKETEYIADTKNVLYKGMIKGKNTEKSRSCEEVKIKRQETKDVTVHIISLPF